MGIGSRLCVQLFLFVKSMVDISACQRIGESGPIFAPTHPIWLSRLYQLQQIVRQCERNIACCSRCVKDLNKNATVSENQWETSYLIESAVGCEVDVVQCREAMLIALQEEEDITVVEGQAEQIALHSMTTTLEVVKCNTRLKREEYKKLHRLQFSVPLKGKSAVSQALAAVRHSLLSDNVALDGFRNQMSIAAVTLTANTVHREQKNRLPGGIILMAEKEGAARAKCIIFSAKQRASQRVHLSDEDPTDTSEMAAILIDEEKELKRRADCTTVDVDDACRVYEEEKAAALTAIESTSIQYVLRTPSEYEMQEERNEDAIEAHAEKLRVTQHIYIPEYLLHPIDSNRRVRPIVIALSRDVSAYSKKRLHSDLIRLLPGLFVTLDDSALYGVNRASMQAVLSSNCSIIMMVDPGLTRLHRNNFLARLSLVVHSLSPVPTVALVLGNEGNCKGYDGDYSLGVGPTDMQAMGDGDIKEKLECNSRARHAMMTDKNIYRSMQALSTLVRAPSSEWDIVLKALYTLQEHPDDDRNLAQQTINISWRMTCGLLSEPLQLSGRLKNTRRGAYSLTRLEWILDLTLQKKWPPKGCSSRQEDSVLDLIAGYVEDWMAVERWTMDRGGSPPPMLSRSAMRGLQSVVWVTDFSAPLRIRTVEESGWRVPLVQLVRASLQDCKVMTSVTKIAGDVHNVTVYREGDLIYFEAYNPISSAVYLTRIRADEVCSLLMPSAYVGQTTSVRVRVLPPTSTSEIYTRLVKLLRLIVLTKNRLGEKELTCHREYSLMHSFTCQLSGHYVLLKCYEAGQGGLFLTAFIFECSALVSILVTEELLADLLTRCDSLDEKILMRDGNAREIMLIMRDRLQLWPKKSTIAAGLFNVQHALHKRACSDSSVESIVSRTQGFKLAVRGDRSAGRVLLTRVVLFNTVPHLVTLTSSSTTRQLTVKLYEPRKRHTMQVRMCTFLRTVLLGGDDDDAKAWWGVLLKRLRVSWKGTPSLILDTVVARAVKIVAGRRMVIGLRAVDDESLVLSLDDTSSGCTFESSLSKAQVTAFLVDDLQTDLSYTKIIEHSSEEKMFVRNIPRTSKESQAMMKGNIVAALMENAGMEEEQRVGTLNGFNAHQLEAERDRVDGVGGNRVSGCTDIILRDMRQTEREGETERGSKRDADTNIDRESVRRGGGEGASENVKSNQAEDSVTAVSLLTIFRERSTIHSLIDRISQHLVRKNRDSIYQGFYCCLEESENVPETIEVHVLPLVRHSITDAMHVDMTLKYSDRLHKRYHMEGHTVSASPHVQFNGCQLAVRESRVGSNTATPADTACTAIIQYTRVQPPVVRMSEELEKLFITNSEIALLGEDEMEMGQGEGEEGSGLNMTLFSPSVSVRFNDIEVSNARRDHRNSIITSSGESKYGRESGSESDDDTEPDTDGDDSDIENDSDALEKREKERKKGRGSKHKKKEKEALSSSFSSSEPRLGRGEQLVANFGSKIPFREGMKTWSGYAIVKVPT